MGASLLRTQARFAVVFAFAALAGFAVLLAPLCRPFFDGFTYRLATLAATLIHVFGGGCLQHGATLSTPEGGFSMEVRDGCNGVNVTILLWAAMVASPGRWKWKPAGMVLGFAAIQAVNLLRLITLFYLGQNSPSIFEFAHLYLWETLIIIDAIIVFAVWSRHAMRP